MAAVGQERKFAYDSFSPVALEPHMLQRQVAGFLVRPASDGSGNPLIEFSDDHRAPGYPRIVTLLGQALAGFSCHVEPALDDVLWRCNCSAGEFEISDDWGGLFVLARQNHTEVIEAVARALVETGAFRRQDAAPSRA